jgi:flagellar hook-associated protein 2
MATNSTSSTSSYSYLQTSSSRFSGLASGMDIDSIVEKLMKAESAKMEKLQQQKQKYEWQREAYRSVNTKLETFRTDTFDNFGKQSDFVTNKVSNSNESKVSATATATASGTLTISNATLAKNAIGISKTINDQLADDGTNTASRSNTTSLSNIGISGSGTFELQVQQQSGNPKTVTVSYDENDTLETIAQKINSQNKGVTAMVGDDGTFSLTSAATGEFTGGTVKLTSDDKNLFKNLGFTDASGNKLTELANGANATYTINGVTKTSQSNSLTISGYNVQLKEDITSSVTISSTLDTDSVVDKVKSFIETYNTLVKDLKGQTSQKKAMDYQPLTDAQKADMTTDEIAKWEEKAKQGIIRNDKSIESALSAMRTALSSVSIETDDIGPNGEKKKMSIFSIGLDTNTDGTIKIKDEKKLREAIESNPQNVANLFTQSSTSTSGEGLVSKLRTAAKGAIDSITLKAGKEGSLENSYTLGKNITDLDKRIADWKERLEDIEERYYKQFTAMETAIQNANTQSSIFSS